MPLGEIASEVVGGLVRFLAQFFVDVVLEVVIKGPGYIICRSFSEYVNPDGVAVVVVGLLFWVIIGVGGYVLFMFVFT